MTLNNRSFTILYNSKEFCCYNSSTPSLAAKKFFSNINKSKQIKKIEFFVKETTNGSKKKLYGPYIGNKDKVYLKNNKLIGGFSQNDLHIEQTNNIPFVKKGDNCLFFKPKILHDKYYYQYIVCKTLFKHYEFKTIIENKEQNIEIMAIDMESLKKLKEFIEEKNVFRTLKNIIDYVIDIKNKSVKNFEDKQEQRKKEDNQEEAINLDKELIKESFIQSLGENNMNIVITKSDIQVKKKIINGITYIFFNPVSLIIKLNEINPTYKNGKYYYKNRLKDYYYRYIIYIKDNQLMFKEIFLDPQTKKISIKQIDINQINKENLDKLNNSSKKLINNSHVNNIYKQLKRINKQNQQLTQTWRTENGSQYAVT